MKIAAISDVHGMYRQLPRMPDCDVLVVAGDVLGQGKFFELQDFLSWLDEQFVEHKIFIAGNHDFALEASDLGVVLPTGIHYLQDSGVTLHGMKFWGSPWTPVYGHWAFMRPDSELAAFWDRIPADVDILITHGPPQGILDRVQRRSGYGLHVGSQTLLDRVVRIKPRVHIFGHIHEHGGIGAVHGATTHYNVAALDEAYGARDNPWTVIEV